ncbi:MAG: methylenetetrahydrofolate reductase [Woeseiaceae bacterium]|nr:methylenetetrahydrofolate reductase [Woeseiaceae bacterium]
MKKFRDQLRTSDFVVTASLPLTPETTARDVRDAAALLKAHVDALQVGDNHDVDGHMSPLAVAALARDAGLDSVMHLSCRDRNRIALQAEILGAAALGVTSLVLMRGDKLPGATALARGVFQVDARQLIELATAIGNNAKLVSPPGFSIGSRVLAFRPDKDWHATRVAEKVDAGSNFLQTQPCLNPDICHEYIARLVEMKLTHRVSIIVEVPVLTRAKALKSMKEHVPGAAIPDTVVKRLARAENTAKEGVAIAAEAIAAMRKVPGVAGVNVVCDTGVQHIVEAIRKSRAIH